MTDNLDAEAIQFKHDALDKTKELKELMRREQLGGDQSKCHSMFARIKQHQDSWTAEHAKLLEKAAATRRFAMESHSRKAKYEAHAAECLAQLKIADGAAGVSHWLCDPGVVPQYACVSLFRCFCVAICYLNILVSQYVCMVRCLYFAV